MYIYTYKCIYMYLLLLMLYNYIEPLKDVDMH